MNKRFVAAVLKLEPDFFALGNYLCERDFSEVICGFLWERTPSGAYIRWFAYPLFDFSEILHLSYGDRLRSSEGFIDSKNIKELGVQALAVKFMQQIRPYRDEVRALRSLAHFATLLRTRAGLGNPHADFCYAQTLVLLGREAEAREQIESARERIESFESSALPKYAHRLLQEIRALRENLDHGLEYAQREIRNREVQKAAILGIEKPKSAVWSEPA